MPMSLFSDVQFYFSEMPLTRYFGWSFWTNFPAYNEKNSNNVKISVGITLFLNSFTDDILMTLNQNEIKMLLKNCFPLSWYITLKTLFFAFLGYMDRLIVTHNHCSCYCSFFVKVRALDSTHICFLYEAEFHLVFVGLSKALFFFRLSHSLALCKLKKREITKFWYNFVLCFHVSYFV